MLNKKNTNLLLFLSLLILFPNFAKSQTGYDYKAVTLLNLIEQTEWVSKPKSGKFIIGVLDPEGSAYKSIENMASFKKSNKYGKIKVRRYKEAYKIKPCEVLFVAKNSINRLDEVTRNLNESNCMIVTEDAALFAQGSHINFVPKNNRLEFVLNKEQLQSSGLAVNDLVNQLALADIEERTASARNNKKRMEEKSKVDNRVKVLENVIKQKEQITEQQIKELETVLDAMNFSDAAKDSLLNFFNNKMRLQRIQSRNVELEKKKFELEMKNDIIRRDAERQARYYYTVLISIIAGFLLILVVVSLIVLQRRKKTIHIINKAKDDLSQKIEEISKQKNHIDFQNKSIHDSIRAAKTIQTAMLPSLRLLNQYLPDNFVFYRPRDIVSGDFYWFAEVESRQPIYSTQPVFSEVFASEESSLVPQTKNLTYSSNSFDYHVTSKILLSAVDCTGHGVPGAFMSMIGHEILNQIVHRRHITDTDKILQELHLSVSNALKQQETGNSDGMDVALCAIEKIIFDDPSIAPTYKIEFSGAKRPIVYIQNDEFHLIQSTNTSIGGYQTHREKKFPKQTFFVQSPCVFYLFSDGFQDQLGGDNRRRYGSERLKQLFMLMHHLPMQEQEKILEKSLSTWKGNIDQVDDVLVMGFKL